MSPQHKKPTPPILLVDDEEGLRRVLGITLSDMGYRVYSAENSDAAMSVFREVCPPIILTDIKMPGKDGIQLLREIKRERPETEVIMLTGHGDLDLAIKSLKYEAIDFITKPINEEVLEIALKRAHERIDMRRQLQAYTENLETLVAEKTRKLLDAERMAAIGRTVASLSHAIKNIAGGLKGGSFVIEKGIELNDKEYLQRGWEMLSGNLEKITRLSLDLLNYAKTTRINRCSGDPNQPAAEVAEFVQPRTTAAGIDFRLDLAASLPSFAFDPEAVHRVLLNLVLNAIDAVDETERPGRAKTITLISRPGPAGGVEYRVVDNGCGMSNETQKRIFQDFFTTKGTRGTGIGLMMTKNIVEKHDGDIYVRSNPARGTTFIVRIPGEKNHASS